jgi:hypothetical protein
MNRYLALLSLLLAALAMTACGKASSSGSSSTSAQSTSADANPTPGFVQQGSWYGSGIQMTVNAQGATIQFNCATGSVPEVLTLDSNNSFDLSGTFAESVQSPTDQTQTATYSGVESASGDSITLSVVTSGGMNLNYTLQPGTTTLENCNI